MRFERATSIVVVFFFFFFHSMAIDHPAREIGLLLEWLRARFCASSFGTWWHTNTYSIDLRVQYTPNTYPETSATHYIIQNKNKVDGVLWTDCSQLICVIVVLDVVPCIQETIIQVWEEQEVHFFSAAVNLFACQIPNIVFFFLCFFFHFSFSSGITYCDT